MKRILVAVSSKPDQEEAHRIIEEAGYDPKIVGSFNEVFYFLRALIWENLMGKRGLPSVHVDAVITDICLPVLPFEHQAYWNAYCTSFKGKVSIDNDVEAAAQSAPANTDSLTPSGAFIGTICKAMGLPLVICTKGYEFIQPTIEFLDVTVVNDSEKYNWQAAVRELTNNWEPGKEDEEVAEDEEALWSDTLEANWYF